MSYNMKKFNYLPFPIAGASFNNLFQVQYFTFYDLRTLTGLILHAL